ncbi:addiction module toxin, HicA family [Streptomyces sp. SID5614]|nr:addiction module toxin, HicA family [Streptomyces sp. SID5614]
MPGFPAMTARNLRKVLASLGYTEVPDSGKGSHTWLIAEGRPRIRWAFHKRELAPIEVRNVLVQQAGLTLDEARRAVGNG